MPQEVPVGEPKAMPCYPDDWHRPWLDVDKHSLSGTRVFAFSLSWVRAGVTWSDTGRRSRLLLLLASLGRYIAHDGDLLNVPHRDWLKRDGNNLAIEIEKKIEKKKEKKTKPKMNKKRSRLEPVHLLSLVTFVKSLFIADVLMEFLIWNVFVHSEKDSISKTRYFPKAHQYDLDRLNTLSSHSVGRNVRLLELLCKEFSWRTSKHCSSCRAHVHGFKVIKMSVFFCILKFMHLVILNGGKKSNLFI